MREKLMILTVRTPGLARKQYETLEADADAALLELVNSAARNRAREQRKQDVIRWIDQLKKREAAVLHRESVVKQKEAKIRALKRTANFVADGLLVLFSTIGIVVSALFIFGL